MFYVGQKVVCVRDDLVERYIARGNVYVVSAIETEIGGVQLEGIGPHTDAEGYDWYFHSYKNGILGR